MPLNDKKKMVLATRGHREERSKGKSFQILKSSIIADATRKLKSYPPLALQNLFCHNACANRAGVCVQCARMLCTWAHRAHMCT
jgi:hypothetical protein